MTFENGLSRTLLSGRETLYIPFAGPRDGNSLTNIAFRARQVLKNRRFGRAISTGSGPAVSVLPQALYRGSETHYIESAARANGPSLSGSLISRVSGIKTYTQYPVWANRRWQYRGSIFDAFEPGTATGNGRVQKVVVTVGTQDGYPFDRLFQTLVPLLRGREVLWQSGTTDLSSYGVDGRHSVPHDELKRAVAEADVVIAHAGTGSAITAIEAGKHPVLVPRLARFREHIDDHQIQIASELQRRGLATMVHADQLDDEVLASAARRSATAATPPPFVLDSERGFATLGDGKGMMAASP